MNQRIKSYLGNRRQIVEIKQIRNGATEIQIKISICKTRSTTGIRSKHSNSSPSGITAVHVVCGIMQDASQGVLEKNLKKWDHQQTTVWKCIKCKDLSQETDSNTSSPIQNVPNITTKNDPDFLNNSVKELENSLTENNFFENETSEEEKLEMAAKIGSVLLNENNSLKEQNLRMKAELASCEEKIEDMRNREDKYTERLENLQHQLIEMQAQLYREKQLRLNSQNVFEEHDTKLGPIIDDYSKKIDNQEKIIKNLNLKIENQSDLINMPESIRISTQTPNSENANSSTANFSSLLYEFLNINKKQEHMEDMIRTLTSQIKPFFTTTEITDIINLTPGASQTSREKLNHHHLTNTEMTNSNNPTPGISQTRRKKLIKPLLTTTEITDIDNPTPGISQTRSKKLIKPSLTTTEMTD
ncbi:hypothetical protein J6590_047238 [Homalodisca vitripennis]|nr:hypothetical protein J6590_047238 [Homalodisca vitripennis]